LRVSEAFLKKCVKTGKGIDNYVIKDNDLINNLHIAIDEVFERIA